MKSNSLFSISLFAAITIFSSVTQAASDTAKMAEAQASAETKVEQSSTKKMKPHSHVEEKTGIPQKAPESTANRPNPAKDMSKHYHPRDGK
ncbi:hypothetical protein GEOBC_02381 [Geobacteraceae bacterium]|jgi:hypothetical protein|nr:hypothetical protein GEOBC_02381 [Geobacteraceae bacterium]